MRKQPAAHIQPPQISHRVHEQTTEQQRTYKIITPLFGGGAVKHECDEITTVRGTEIRGHLRFWWRATCAGHLADIEAVKKREDLIWGKANNKKEPGPKHEETVQIEASLQKESERVAPFKTVLSENAQQKNKQVSDSSTRIHPYVAFPLQLTRDELAQKSPPPAKEVSKEGIEFTVTITFPNAYTEDVEAALWAWETFGGIGARTRRGFGALQLLTIDGHAPTDKNLPPSSGGAKRWLEGKLATLPAKDHGFPYISPSLHLRVVQAVDPMACWKKLVEKLANFRQGIDGVRRGGWPEAENVRELTGPQRSDPSGSKHLKKFPRAAFGLPIIFHFIRDDPADTTLQPGGGSDRLASPLILKPLACQNGQACGLAVILDGYTIPSPLILKEKNGKTHQVEHQLVPADLRTLSSLKLNNKVDILAAFLDYLSGDSK